jgi:hypothetical protein
MLRTLRGPARIHFCWALSLSSRSSSSRSPNNEWIASRQRRLGWRTLGNYPQEDQIAAQCQAFDYDTAERAEIVREHEVLEPPTDGILKNEDEITKKWIALI